MSFFIAMAIMKIFKLEKYADTLPIEVRREMWRAKLGDTISSFELQREYGVSEGLGQPILAMITDVNGEFAEVTFCHFDRMNSHLQIKKWHRLEKFHVTMFKYAVRLWKHKYFLNARTPSSVS